MTALTTHVLNISNVKPANNLHIELVFYQGTKKIKLGNITQWNLIKITKFLGIEAIIEGINIF